MARGKEFVVTITSKGQVTIPAELRSLRIGGAFAAAPKLWGVAADC